jgi:protein-S-isoprenylcysteine O-methyltransferase Ste14
VAWLAAALALVVVPAWFGFLLDAGWARSIDGEPEGPTRIAVLVNGLLVGLFGLQHSLMAREGFKRRAARLFPRAFERSLYNLSSSLALLLMLGLWRPLPRSIWELDAGPARAASWALFVFGCGVIVVATLGLDPLGLAGLRPAPGSAGACVTPFQVTGLHRLVRHPTYAGWLLVLWAAPSMSMGRLLLAVLLTLYVLIAIQFEERDLLGRYGEVYARYRRGVPMLLPWRARLHARIEPRARV